MNDLAANIGCTECGAAASEPSLLCERHLRGHTLFVLDRARWPRLMFSDGREVARDDAWRPWLREADGEALSQVLRLLEQAPGSWGHEG